MKSEVYKLFQNCIPVKGTKKSIICDLQRGSYIYIPNDLYNILVNFKDKDLEEIKKFYKNKYDDIIDNYFKILFDGEYVFKTKTPELFPDMELSWDEPFEITNSIIDIEKNNSYLLETLNQLSSINCKFLQLRFFRKVLIDEIIDILSFLNDNKSNSIGIDIIIPYDVSYEKTDLKRIFLIQPRLNLFLIYSTPNISKIENIAPSKYIIQTEKNIISEKNCGIIDKSLFAINIKNFTESKLYNSCLNRKISINARGDIKNCPSMSKDYGNIKTTSLRTVLINPEFKRYWGITKDQINVCKDCEFRYICTDCRAYLENPKNYLSKPLKCGYNPYTNKWEDWNQNPLSKEPIAHYDLERFINEY